MWCSAGAMEYSVVTGPINFGAASSGQPVEQAHEVDPFMGQVSLRASADDDMTPHHTHEQPPGSWPDIAVPSVQPGEHVRSNAPSQRALTGNAAAALAEKEVPQNPYAPPVLDPLLGDTSTKGQASDSEWEDLTSVTQSGHSQDRQLQDPEVHEASDPPEKADHSSLNGHRATASTQHAVAMTSEIADGDSPKLTSAELAIAKQDAFQGSSSHGTVPPFAEETDAPDRYHRQAPACATRFIHVLSEGYGAPHSSSLLCCSHRDPVILHADLQCSPTSKKSLEASLPCRECPSRPGTVQQHNQAAAKARADPSGPAAARKAQQVESATEQHEEQEAASLPGLQPIVSAQYPSTAGLVHLASGGKGPATADHQHRSEQPGRSLLAKPATLAGSAFIPHTIASGGASAQQSDALHFKAGVVQSTEQQASLGSSPARHSARAPLKERGAQDQDPGNASESMSAAPHGIDGYGWGEADDAAEANRASSTVSTISPTAVALAPSAGSHSLHQSSHPAVPLASADRCTESDGQSQASDLQQGPSLPPPSSERAAVTGKEPAQSQPHTADGLLTSKSTEQAWDPHESNPVPAKETSSDPFASCQSEHQSGSSAYPHDAHVHGSPQEGPMASTSLQTASAGATHAAGTEHRQAEPRPEPFVEHMAASTPGSDVTHAGSERTTPGAEPGSATQDELLALAHAVSQLEVELADAREAIARRETEAETARQEAAQWQDREADARAQVLLVASPAALIA